MNELENFADQMVFTEEEYEAIEGMLLEEQYQMYKNMCEVLKLKEEGELNFQRLRISELPVVVQDAFLQHARKYLEEYGI